MHEGQKYCVVTTDERSVVFTIEEEVAYASDRYWHDHCGGNRWNELEVVKTTTGKFVLRRSFVSQWAGEGADAYTVFDSLEELAKTLDITADLDRTVLEELDLLHEMSEAV